MTNTMATIEQNRAALLESELNVGACNHITGPSWPSYFSLDVHRPVKLE